MKFETRILTMDEAVGFLQNMRAFADIGPISARKLGPDRVRVRALRGTWSLYVFD